MPSSSAPQRRPRDADRAQRIARAAIDVVSERGVAGLTHRAVADRAGVPLGSTTYYFAKLEDILEAAMREAMATGNGRLKRWRAGVGPDDDLADALARLVDDATGPHRAALLVEWELYLAAVRSPGLRSLSVEWGNLLPDALAAYTDRVTARALAHAMFGLQLESLISGRRLRADDALPVLRRVLAGAPDHAGSGAGGGKGKQRAVAAPSTTTAAPDT